MQAVFSAIGRFFTSLLKMIADFATFVLDVFIQIFVDLFELLTDLIYTVLASVLTLAVSVMSNLNPPSFNIPDLLSGLPSELLNIAGLIGAGSALSIVIGAIGIRFLLQTIPFVRWGS